MSSITTTLPVESGQTTAEGRRNVRDSLVVTVGGQLERILGTFTALALRWGLDPALLGVYTGLRLYLDQTNRSSLGVSLGAVQEIPILRAAGEEVEAQRVADVAYTTNTLTCAVYIVALLAWAWIRAPRLAADPLANEWTWGLVVIAGLAVLKRYESFLVAVLRAHREFKLTTELDIVESLASAVAVSAGLWLAGFWGLLTGVGALLAFKILYLHARHPLRFRWDWHWPTAMRLMRVGLPILANTAVFGAVLSLDRVLILWRVPDGDRAMGLYTIAIMGTSWSLDLAGRIVLVMYTAFQTTLGRTRDPREVALQAMRATEAQAPLLAAGSAVAYLVGPLFLGTLIPRYADGLPALRPLLLGTFMLGLAWPARQVLITLERPVRLFLATLLGLAVTAIAGTIGADRAGIVGVAWGMTIGYSTVSLLTNATALAPVLGWRAWSAHQGRLVRTLAWYAAGAMFSAHLSIGVLPAWAQLPARCLFLAGWILPALWYWGHRHGWGGMTLRRPKPSS
ncbi:lipopolysaccharide biosynthesis protein [Singulisphaera acidiphila]|uniref:lipopolysaccharide biosynthesis protein n=1 Tax=Singulisphaera acidiphila TaxID=466153 RepID=UPI001ED9437A|nr:oligosaccharide flippase family protein [Singulisphaera acidiphila]